MLFANLPRVKLKIAITIKGVKGRSQPMTRDCDASGDRNATRE